MKKAFLLISFFTMQLFFCGVMSAKPKIPIYKNASKSIDARVDDLLSRMTIEEKAGQLNQLNAGPLTGPGSNPKNNELREQQVREGKVGSFLNLTGVADTRTMQRIAVEQSRLGIPLLFALDVIHGYRTIFPIPLAEACSWDINGIEENASVAAAEATASGVHWTFAPMCDVSNDPRWGRVMEGAGEDPYLAGVVSAARVRGFQGNDLADGRHIMACVKHFAAYGAVEAGKEYAHVDVSRYALWNKYLPPYKAAIEAGAATIMNAFNVFEGVPATASTYLNHEVLKDKLKFKGFAISDWNTYTEMIHHGYAANPKDGLEKAMNGGGEMEMNSQTAIKYLPQSVKEGKIKMSVVDDAVRRILKAKFQMGLFDNPYLFCNYEREKTEVFSAQNRSVARKAAANTLVLLKNEKQLLPLKSSAKIALIGYYANSHADMFDFWTLKGNSNEAVTVREGLSSVFPGIVYSDGYMADATTNDSLINNALEASRNADVLLVNIGLSGKLAGEDRSLANIKIPAGQQRLLDALRATGKPVVALISSGRPMVLTQIVDKVDAILQCWIPGTETGNAVADVLTGVVNPSAKTVMSFPYDEGQIPVYYNYFNTGRPYSIEPGGSWFSRYRDIPNDPLYPFGYGLSYTDFSYNDMKINKTEFSKNDTVRVSVKVKNTGNYDGYEIVQLYIKDPVASHVRPVKELKKFEKVLIKKGEERQINFRLTASDLGFYNAAGDFLIEPGAFSVMIGTNSQRVSKLDFTVLK